MVAQWLSGAQATNHWPFCRREEAQSLTLFLKFLPWNGCSATLWCSSHQSLTLLPKRRSPIIDSFLEAFAVEWLLCDFCRGMVAQWLSGAQATNHWPFCQREEAQSLTLFLKLLPWNGCSVTLWCSSHQSLTLLLKRRSPISDSFLAVFTMEWLLSDLEWLLSDSLVSQATNHGPF